MLYQPDKILFGSEIDVVLSGIIPNLITVVSKQAQYVSSVKPDTLELTVFIPEEEHFA